MRHCVAAELFLLAGTAWALPEISVVKRDRHTNGRTNNVARGLVKRAGTLETVVWSGVGYVSGGAYYANITVGTPPQLQIVSIDTGSSDLYLDARNSAACEASGPHSCVATDFQPGSSSTYKVVNNSPAFNASYGDGSTAIGPYVSDTVCINDICIENVEFGLAQDVHSTVGPSIGLLGIGYDVQEALSDADQLYPNLPDVLVSAGVINSRTYSLYLNDFADITGSVLFGGLDTDKYTGDLQTVDILPDIQTSLVDRFITVVTGLKATSGGNTQTIFSGGETGVNAYAANSGSLPVLLDSGSSAWSVPVNVFEGIVSQFSYIDPKTGSADCADVNDDDHLTITFDDKIDIDVPITQWLTPVYNSQSGDLETLPGGGNACGIGIIPSQGTGLGFDTMGDAIMRSMYIVYDLDNGQMSLAQAKTGSTSSSIKAIPAGPGGVAKVAQSFGSPVPSQSYSIHPFASSTVALAVSTAKTAVGTATGMAAVPTAAQVQAGGDGSGSGSGARALHPMGWSSTGGGVWWSACAAVMVVVLGAGFVL